MFNFLILSGIFFIVGLWGFFLVKRHLMMILISLEILLLSINLNFCMFSVYLDDIFGQFCSLFVLTVAAGESALVWLYYWFIIDCEVLLS